MRAALTEKRAVAVVVVIMIAGAMLRALPLMASDFPVNDGGMFATMANELQANALALPSHTSYNGGAIPFAYPPLGLWLTAVAGLGGMAITDALRLLPLLLSIGTIPVVYLIGRELLGSWQGAGLASAFFAFSTGSYEWLVMGGGVTRALGFLAALTSVLLAIRLYRQGRVWQIVGCGVALGATALSHPQAAVFGAVSVPLLLPFTATIRVSALRNLVLVGVVAIVTAAPWLAVVLLKHGPEPFVSAASTGGGLLLGVVSLASSRTSGGVLEIIGVATTFGLVVCLVRRFWLPPVWMLAIAVVDSRAGQPYLAVPAALAIAFLFLDIYRVLEPLRGRGATTRRWLTVAPIAIAVVIAGAAFFDSVASQSAPGSPLRALPRLTRSAMEWVRSTTEPGARFAVVSGRYWASDSEAEWFPALAERRSIATVQGTEWLGTYEEALQRAGDLPACTVADDRACIEDWFSTAGPVDYLFLVDTPSREIGGFTCCLQLEDQLSGIYSTEVVHREGDVVVVRLTPRS